jgi:hypothetical protein
MRLMIKKQTLAALLAAGLISWPTTSLIAQEAEKPPACCAPGATGGTAGCCEPGAMRGSMECCAPGKMAQAGMMKSGRMAEMRKMREEMEALHQEMENTLQRKLNALREHAKSMDTLTDEKALLTEMKQHQQMTDELLGTLVGYHEQMHAKMKERHEHMRGMQHHMQQAPETKTEQ